ncbi:Run domain Beclin-1-interacting and cysteine-rich domain-containing protein [Dirofilaria immitis]
MFKQISDNDGDEIEHDDKDCYKIGDISPEVMEYLKHPIQQKNSINRIIIDHPHFSISMSIYPPDQYWCNQFATDIFPMRKISCWNAQQLYIDQIYNSKMLMKIFNGVKMTVDTLNNLLRVQLQVIHSKTFRRVHCIYLMNYP